MTSLAVLYEQFCQFIFPFAYYEHLALLRIGLACIVGLQALELVRISPHLLAENGLAGVSAKWLLDHNRGFNLFRFCGLHPASLRIVFAVQALACVFLALGLFSHIALAVVVVIAISRSNCTWTLVHGGHLLPTSILTLMLVSPLNARFSLDQFYGLATWSDHPFIASNWAFRLIQIQVCFMYLLSFLWKAKVPAWRNGKATYAALVTSWWRRESILLPILARSGISRAFSHFTMMVELLAPLLLWAQATRGVALLSLALLHIGIGLSFRLWYFTWASMTLLLSFVPTSLLAESLSLFSIPEQVATGSFSLSSPGREIAVILFFAIAAKMWIFGGPESPLILFLRKKCTLGNYFSLFTAQWEMFALPHILDRATRYTAQLHREGQTEVWRPQHFLEKRFCLCLWHPMVQQSFLQFLKNRYPGASIEVIQEVWEIPPLREGFFSQNETDLAKLKKSSSVLLRHPTSGSSRG